MTSIFELSCVSDIHFPQVYYIVTQDNKKYARLYKKDGLWCVWYYTEKYGILRKNLDAAFLSIERQYNKNKREIPAEPSRKSN